MSGVDNRIVTMQFNNKDFEKNAQTSLTTLQKLKQGMPTVSYQAASDISNLTQAAAQAAADEASKPPPPPSEVNYTQILQSPKPIDSVASYRAGKSLIALKKEELTK